LFLSSLPLFYSFPSLNSLLIPSPVRLSSAPFFSFDNIRSCIGGLWFFSPQSKSEGFHPFFLTGPLFRAFPYRSWLSSCFLKRPEDHVLGGNVGVLAITLLPVLLLYDPPLIRTPALVLSLGSKSLCFLLLLYLSPRCAPPSPLLKSASLRGLICRPPRTRMLLWNLRLSSPH